RLGKDCRPAFHIQKSSRSTEGKNQLHGIEQMKQRQIVLAKTNVFETSSQQFRIHKEIRHHNDHRTLSRRFSELVQHFDKVGLALATDVLERVEDRAQVRRIP